MKINDFKNKKEYIVYAPEIFAESTIGLLKKSSFLDKVSLNEGTFDLILEEAENYLKKLFAEYEPPQVEEEIIKNGITTKVKKPAFNISAGQLDTALNKSNKILKEKVLNAFPITKLHGRFLQPNKEKFETAFEKLFIGQTTSEKNIIKQWLWTVARDIKGLPVKYKTMLCLFGSQGTGKSFLAECISKIIQGFVYSKNIDSYLEDMDDPVKLNASVVIFDELGKLNKTTLNALKAKITAPTEVFNAKYKETKNIKNQWHYILTTNDTPYLLSQDTEARRLAIVNYKSTLGLYTEKEVMQLLKDIWTYIPYDDNNFINETEINKKIIESSKQEYIRDTLEKMAICIDPNGENLLERLILEYDKGIRITELAKEMDISNNAARKILSIPELFKKKSETSKIYIPNIIRIKQALKALDEDKDLFEDENEKEKQISETDLLRQRNIELMQEIEKLKEALQNKQTQKENLTPEEKEVQDFVNKFKLGLCIDEYSKPVTELERGTNYPYLVNGTCTTNDRKAENVIPQMFVFEMDKETKEDQEEIIDNILNGDYKNNIASVTWSGNKSYHVLVPHNCNREIKNFYKYYWEETAKKIYGDNWIKLDKACASIGRLTRCFNMQREKNTKDDIYFEGIQKKYYLNTNAEAIDLTDLVNQKEKEEGEKRLKNLTFTIFNPNAYSPFNLNIDQGIKLENIAQKYPSNENYQTAKEIYFTGKVEKGINPVAIIQSLKKSGFSRDFVERNIYKPMHRQHPSNTGQKFEYYWK